MSFLQDIQYGWRNLIKSPGFLTVAVLSLGLGIGANTALFSLIYSALFRSLPIADPHQLVLFNDPNAEGMAMGASNGERGLLTWEEFEQLRGIEALDGAFAVQSMLPKIHLRIDGIQEEAHGKLVSGSYFSVLRLLPQIGRFFEEASDRTYGSTPYIVLSDAYWTRRFGRDLTILGKNIVIQKTSFDVIGVAPRGFSGENVGENPDFWAPLTMQMQMYPGIDFLHPMPDPTMKVMWLHMFGRLRSGATSAEAQSEASTIFKASLEQSYKSLSTDAKKPFMDQRLKLRPAATGASGVRSDFSQSAFVIFTAVGATLLICCANLSNLLLSRAISRQREITVRLALGASKWRVARQLFTEGLLLSAIGAGLGLVLSQAVCPWLLRMASPSEVPIYLKTDIDWRVLLFTAALAVMTTLICTLMPSVRAARTGLVNTLKEGGRSMTASRGVLMAGRLFVATQIALSLLLLVGAGLFLRTFLNLQSVDLGYTRDNLAMVAVDATPAGYNGDKRGQLFLTILEKLRSAPGVRSVSFSQNGLFSGSESGDAIQVEGYTAKGKEDKGSRFDLIGPGYFSSLGIPLLEGREVTERDTAKSPTICIINEAFAKQFFAGRDPIGKHVTDVYGDSRTVFEVIGVAKNSRDHSLRGEVKPRIFVSLLQAKFGGEMSRGANYEVRIGGGSGSILNVLRKTVLAVDENVDVETRFLTRSIDEQLSQERLIANLVTMFGLLALGLAAIGIYGVLAYGVSQRTGEIGVRMAIGAAARDVIKMILRETVFIVVGGLGVGLVAAYFLTRLVQSKLFGVTTTDPKVLVSSIFIMALIGLLAATVPAFRASRIDPAIALRDE